MKALKFIKVSCIALSLFGITAAAQAADTTVDLALDQDIELTGMDIESADGEVRGLLGSVEVAAKSEVDAQVDSKLNVDYLNAVTKDGKATAAVGSVVVGN